MKNYSVRPVLAFYNEIMHLDSGEKAPEWGKGNSVIFIETICSNELSELLIKEYNEGHSLEELKQTALDFYNNKNRQLVENFDFDEDRIKIIHNFSPKV